MTYCGICNEDVTAPCETVEEARADGCIIQPKFKPGLNPDIAKRVAAQVKGVCLSSSGPSSHTKRS